MSAPRDDVLAAATAIIAAFGEDVTFTTPAAGVYDPATRSEAPGGRVTWTTTARVYGYADGEVNGNSIKTGDRKVQMLYDERVDLTTRVLLRGEDLGVVPPLGHGPMNTYLVLQVRK